MAVVELTEEPRVDYLRAALGLLPTRRGAELPDVELVRRGVTVDRDHLAAYDRVCEFRLADTLPATYPHVLAFPLAMRLMSAAGFPFPVVGLVHVANRITVRRPLRADEPMDLAVRVADLRPHHRGRQFDVVASAIVGGEQVWTDVSTYLSKGGSTEDRPESRPDPSPRGDRPAAQWRLTPRVGTDYAAASGDRNPIHTSRIGARLFGFPRPIAHGMWSKARCLAALEGRLPDAYTVDVAFKAPILLPGRVAFAAERTADGWEFTLIGRRPHLVGEVTPP
jgi:acyl dehydratase